jgi:hypothetical protein
LENFDELSSLRARLANVRQFFALDEGAMAFDHFHRSVANPRGIQEAAHPLPQGTALPIIIICSLAGWALLALIGKGLLRLAGF